METEKVLTAAEESAQRNERLTRVLEQEKSVADAKADRIAKIILDSAKVNKVFAAKEEALAKQCAENKPRSLPKQTNADAVAAAKAAYPYTPYDPNQRDVLMEMEPKYVQELHGYVSKPIPRSLVAPPQPKQGPQYDPLKRPQPEMAEILANRPMSAQDQRNAEMMIPPTLSRPTVPCKNCGDQISPAAGYHRRADDSICVLDETFAKREGIIIPVKPVVKKSKK
jgi:hypothetical protein